MDIPNIKEELKTKKEELDWNTRKRKPYGYRKRDILFGIYLAAIILWGILMIYLQPNVSIYGWIILLIPIIVFLLTTISLDSLSALVEENVFQLNTLATGLLIVLPLLS